MKISVFALLGCFALSGSAYAQSMPHMDHGESPSNKAFMDGMKKMDKGMSAPMSGDADRDFAAMMIAHHQGAIDMARVELQYGKDPMLRKLSEDIIKAQETEIAQMKAWQEKRGK
jgi:uncharacterized protein (DUF305 family)